MADHAQMLEARCFSGDQLLDAHRSHPVLQTLKGKIWVIRGI
jgi:hypothetical protein